MPRSDPVTRNASRPAASLIMKLLPRETSFCFSTYRIMVGSPTPFITTHFGLPGNRFSIRELPELALANDGDVVALLREASDLEQLCAADLAGDLERVESAAYEHVRRRPGLGHHRRARFPRRGDRFASRPAQKSGEGDSPPLEGRQPAGARLPWAMPERVDELARCFVALSPGAEAAIDDFLE